MAEYELKEMSPGAVIEAENVTSMRAPSPVQLIETALRSNASVETLERLFALQERYDAGEARKAYARALVAFRAENIVVDKDKQVDFTNKNGVRTQYKHATLGNILDKVTPALARHGLSHQWFFAQSDGFMTVTCRLIHVDGHSEETQARGPYDGSGNKNDIQGVGSVASYLERYTFCALTGTTTAEMDDDARGAGVSVATITLDQQIEIQDGLKETNSNAAAFLQYIGADSIENIPASAYRKAMNAIDGKRRNA